VLQTPHCDKGKIHPITCPEGTGGGSRGIAVLLLILALAWDGWLMPRFGCFTIGNDLRAIVYEAGWALELVWMSVKNLAPIGIQFLDCPAPSELLSYFQNVMDMIIINNCILPLSILISVSKAPLTCMLVHVFLWFVQYNLLFCVPQLT